ncbi:conserved hypothetical protein [Cryptococcus deneoformans JEC21]|uniref:Velvet domain-containing protein n=1 Tax=Cryptococcus deneoformans (strain JEC21 / ATCC MYA-565) TaxID=214684 RepID=A0A0S2M5V5_CRYD1|nr:conserved hypothetical protein [Cryptococcus neoformans var. neoformans JEC21]ALO69007.1 conserved hypothetical protein [Cryptococcus neoformans var. neoformans JEC21]
MVHHSQLTSNGADQMSFYVYPPPPPPGYQLVYVPPFHTTHLPRQRPCSTSSLPTTPSNPYPPHLPTPSYTPMSIRHCSSVATDHDCILRTYELTMRQQPVQARMCGIGDKSDRRPVDPTPIIQLKVIDPQGDDITSIDPQTRQQIRRPSGSEGMTYMQNPYYFLFACLVGGEEQEDELHVIDDGKTRFLTGTPVSSLYHLKDLDNSDAAFFVFPDLGVRKEGRYKLKLTLFEIVDQEVYYCTTMFTSTFSVYSAKKFPGMSKATDLSVSFAEQGLKIRVRKDPRQPARATASSSGKSKRKSDAHESEEEAPAQGQSKRTRGLSMGYPGHEQRFHPPPGEHHYYPYPPNYPPPSGYYPPSGHPMPPPPPPSAYDPYRSHMSRSGSPYSYHPPYPPYSAPGYPPPPSSNYHVNSGRPSTNPESSPSRHRHSLPPPGYVLDPRPIPLPSSHGHHAYPTSSGMGYPPYPMHSESYDRAGVPWAQERRPTLPPPPLPESAMGRPGSRGTGHHSTHPSSLRQGVSPLESPGRLQYAQSPDMGSYRPLSSASTREGRDGRERERERELHRGSPVILPPITRSPVLISQGLPSITDPRESRECLNQSESRASVGGDSGSRPSSSGKNKMGLGNLLG